MRQRIEITLRGTPQQARELVSKLESLQIGDLIEKHGGGELRSILDERKTFGIIHLDADENITSSSDEA